MPVRRVRFRAGQCVTLVKAVGLMDAWPWATRRETVRGAVNAQILSDRLAEKEGGH